MTALRNSPSRTMFLASQALVELRTISLRPAPHSRVVGFQTTFLKQFFNIAQRKQVPKIPADRTQNQLRLGLPPFKDRRAESSFWRFQVNSSISTMAATRPRVPKRRARCCVVSNLAPHAITAKDQSDGSCQETAVAVIRKLRGTCGGHVLDLWRLLLRQTNPTHGDCRPAKLSLAI